MTIGLVEKCAPSIIKKKNLNQHERKESMVLSLADHSDTQSASKNEWITQKEDADTHLLLYIENKRWSVCCDLEYHFLWNVESPWKPNVYVLMQMLRFLPKPLYSQWNIRHQIAEQKVKHAKYVWSSRSSSSSNISRKIKIKQKCKIRMPAYESHIPLGVWLRAYERVFSFRLVFGVSWILLLLLLVFLVILWFFHFNHHSRCFGILRAHSLC